MANMDEYKKLLDINKMKLDYQNMLHMHKIKDLHNFANSIIEIMVGRGEENNAHDDKHGKKCMEIQLDAIPLNWGKIPEIQQIFEIIQLCYGPYNTNCNIKVDTTEILNKIHSISKTLYHKNFLGTELCKNDEKHNEDERDENRINSVSYNDLAVQRYLSLNAKSAECETNKVYEEMHQLLDRALEISPNN